jgi:hypothetical protein
MEMFDQFLGGDTRQFTFVCSVAPDAAPWLTVYGPNSFATLVASVTSIQSAATEFYAMYTFPGSAFGMYKGIWRAEKTVAGSAYPFITERLFSVVDPRRSM